MPPLVSVIVPTFNEGGNVDELLHRLDVALAGVDAEVLFVDDSTDNTPDIIDLCSERVTLPVRLLRRTAPIGGLAGAVAAGIWKVEGEYVVVMDGDLQHPPEMASLLLETARAGDVDLVVASRYCGEGDASGLSSGFRRTVSSGSTLLAQTCFPRRVGRVCTDPMTGFFCFRRTSVELSRLRPRGFKILLEILARHDLRVAELPFVFGERGSGESKASWGNGALFVWQMLALRLSRMERFAAVGALGTVLNLLLLMVLLDARAHYLPAAVVASEVAILHNFLMQERFVFNDMKGHRPRWQRCAIFFGFNNVELAVRIPLLIALVSGLHLHAVLAQALTLALAFLVRFVFVSRVIYRPRRPATAALVPVEIADARSAA